MSEESSCLVDYQLCKIQKDDEIYKKGYVWAEPDVAAGGAVYEAVI